MDEKARLLYSVLEALEKEGFEVSDRCDIRPSCFDLFARRHILLLLLKVLGNIDGLTNQQAGDLAKVARMVSASPLLVGERTRMDYLQDGVMYERYGIPTVTPNTLEDVVDKGVLPLVMSTRGGYYVQIDGDELRKEREEQRLSYGDIAEKLGVSRKTVYRYENEGGCASVERAMKLEEFLNAPVVRPVDIFRSSTKTTEGEATPSDEPSLEHLEKMGFQVHSVKKAPFDALALESQDIMFTKVIKKRIRNLLKKAVIMQSISRTSGKDAFFISEGRMGKTNIAGLPIVDKGELEAMDDSEDLMDVLGERRA